MYLSETEVYQRFFAAVKKAVNTSATAEYEADIYSQISEIKGMIDLTEELVKEEK